MLQAERQQQILSLLEQQGAMRVGQLAALLYTSEATVRRDLTAMEHEGLVRRVFGGVMLRTEEPPLEIRRQENAVAKEKIAALAATLIHEGSTLFVDASSTAQCLVPHLKRFSELTVVTNSHRVLEALSTTRLHVISTGGHLVPRNMAMVGRVAERALAEMHLDLAFFSSQGVNETGEITDFSEEETALRRTAMSRAGKTVFLCDGSKANKAYLHRLGALSDMDYFVTDGGFSAVLMAMAKNTLTSEHV